MKMRISPRFAALAVVVSTLAACGGGGGGGPPPPAPVVTLTASATDVAVNGSVTLTWNSTNATACTAAGGWSGSLATAGSMAEPVAASSTYTVTCTGGGGSQSQSVAVTAWNAPAPNVTASATSVFANTSVTVSWSAQNATACTGANGLAGVSSLSGSQVTAALTTSTAYSLSCTNPAFPTPVQGSVTVAVVTTVTLSYTIQYQAPGLPVVDAQSGYDVPDWSNPVTQPVPFVWVELQNGSGTVLQQVYADANGVATFTGLDPTVTVTPVVRSAIQSASPALDFVVLDNTTPLDTSKVAFRQRYGTYAIAGPPYTPATSGVAAQSGGTLTAVDGWDAGSKTLVDANRHAAPLELLANAVHEAQIVSAAIGGTPAWRPLTILWSTRNKGGLTTPPENYDQGLVLGSGGFYSGAHGGIDPTGAPTLATVTEDYEFISGDQSFEPMDLYPFVLTHEMGHFVQSLFSTFVSPGGDHSYADHEDPTLAWVEGNASGTAALVLNTPEQNRVQQVTVSGQPLLAVAVVDVNADTNSGHPLNSPVGWFQESTVTRLMWRAYVPGGTVQLSAPAVLAPMFTSSWNAVTWLNTPWAYSVQLAKLNPAKAAAIDTLADGLNIRTTGDDEWGTAETNSGNQTSKDALPPYTTATIGGGPVQVCAHGAPNDYNQESNVRYLRVAGDNLTHTITVTGPSGTVPALFAYYYTPGSTSISKSFKIPAGDNAFFVGDCAVALSPYSTDTAACNEPAAPPVEQCFTVTVQ
ncbi:MAG: hypothetical protein JSR54_02445 [Proteobacteria bacterium]|nr:hypothetical protein [Pseudomonadota bacterium]